MSRSAQRAGFTFLEIMLVVLIIGILVSIVVPNFIGKSEQARRQATNLAIRNTEVALGQFEIVYGAFPDELRDLVDPPEPPAGGDVTPFLDEMPKDAWQHVLQYNYPGEYGGRYYDLYSMGRNGTDDRGQGDDIPGWSTDDETDL